MIHTLHRWWVAYLWFFWREWTWGQGLGICAWYAMVVAWWVVAIKTDWPSTTFWAVFLTLQWIVFSIAYPIGYLDFAWKMRSERLASPLPGKGL